MALHPSSLLHFPLLHFQRPRHVSLREFIVKRWLQPSIPPEFLVNQYAYRPTGSTTVVLVHLFHSLTRMIEDTTYVDAVLIDFTKAADIGLADHTVLMSKLAELQLPGKYIQLDRIISICSSTSLSFQSVVQFLS